MRFSTNDHTKAWRHFGVRPPADSSNPERTQADFCHYNPVFKRYVYTEAWVKYLTRKLGDEPTYELIVGRSANTGKRLLDPTR